MSVEGRETQAHLVLRGRVQGVNFRWALLRQAQSHGLGGWVRNRRDGAVEAVLQGPEDAVRAVVSWAQRGPPGAWVSSADIEWSDVETRVPEFEIRA